MNPQPLLRTTHAVGGLDNPRVYDRWGGSGRPVVLLHGLLFDRTMWWPLAAELASSCVVIAPDLPGHGESAPRDDYSFDQIVQDLATLVYHLHLRRAPVIVGHGTAAWLAAAFAGTYATHRLITVDEPVTAPETVDDLIAAAHVEDVPDIFREYVRPRRDAVLFGAYRSWLAASPTGHRKLKRLLGAPDNSRGRGCFRHLSDPAAFAADIGIHL